MGLYYGMHVGWDFRLTRSYKCASVVSYLISSHLTSHLSIRVHICIKNGYNQRGLLKIYKLWEGGEIFQNSPLSLYRSCPGNLNFANFFGSTSEQEGTHILSPCVVVFVLSNLVTPCLSHVFMNYGSCIPGWIELKPHHAAAPLLPDLSICVWISNYPDSTEREREIFWPRKEKPYSSSGYMGWSNLWYLLHPTCETWTAWYITLFLPGRKR